VDLAGRLEADPTDFDVTNAVAESSLLLQTMTRGFPMRRGFWRAFVLPVGFEVGQNLGTNVPEGSADTQGPPPPSVNRIARLKAGGGLTVFFDNAGAQLSLRRLELEVSGVLRHLFLDESRFDEAAGTTSTTDDGVHGVRADRPEALRRRDPARTLWRQGLVQPRPAAPGVRRRQERQLRVRHRVRRRPWQSDRRAAP
jgi:hypothetical protein